MDRSEVKGFIAMRVAKDLQDGDVVNLGIGLPTLVPSYLPEGVEVILHSENGILGTGAKPNPHEADPRYKTDAGGQSAHAASYGSYIDSATSFSFVRGGHVNVTILGGLEVDQEGNLANWIIPGKKMPGMGGAMDLLVGAKKVIVAMEHTAKGKPKILKKCTLPYTAVNCVDKIITEMCVFIRTSDGLVMTEINPEYTVKDVRMVTEAEFQVVDDLKSM
ncbi:MAG: 3-oxoacid CoA-transferase subunit B [Oscillospiraceae bacterium]|nr:3-oxoacid CoA-transferase subunit B [Oscillospiraceae bacterium]